jgi:hypothetical protein
MMLRHIALVTLALTVSASIIPTKVNAATLGVRLSPRSIGGELVANPGDLITVVYTLRLDSDSKYVIPKSLTTYRDPNELSLFTPLQWLVTQGRSISYEVTGGLNIDIAQLSYKVEKPVRTGRSDVWAILTYDDYDLNLDELILGLKSNTAAGPDVVPQQPVPEPLTMLGAAAALGYGAILKRKYSKEIES